VTSIIAGNSWTLKKIKKGGQQYEIEMYKSTRKLFKKTGGERK